MAQWLQEAGVGKKAKSGGQGIVQLISLSAEDQQMLQSARCCLFANPAGPAAGASHPSRLSSRGLPPE